MLGLKYSKKRLKRLFRRDRDPSSGSITSAAASKEGGDSMPPTPVGHKDKTKSKSALRTASAVASHGFDVAHQLSDAFGPLKSVVNGVGYAKDVWQNVKTNEKEARVLRSEVHAFRDQVDSVVPDVSTVPSSIICSLQVLDKELDDVDKVANLLSEDSVASRILHWKERDSRLKEAATRFRAAKERFSMGCILTAVVSCRTPANREVLQVKMGENKEDRKPQGARDNKAKTVLMTIFLYSLFGCNGSVVVRAIINW